MSPEQAAGSTDLDARTDVYSLGVVTYEMLVGGIPGLWVSDEALRAGRFLDASPEHRAKLDRLPPGVELALVRAMAVSRQHRFPSPGDFASALENPADLARHATGVGAPLSQPPSVAPAWPESGLVEAGPQALATPGFLGAPTVISAERVADGEVPESEHEALVEEARAAFGVVGHTSRKGQTLIWTARRPKKPTKLTDLGEMFGEGWEGDPPDAMVRVVSRGGRTRITVEQRLDGTAGGVFAGVMGGGGGGVAATILAVGIAAFNVPPEVAVTGALASLGGAYWLSRAIYRAVVRHRAARVEGLADRLAEHSENAAPGPRP
jgi:hypothetical protein